MKKTYTDGEGNPITSEDWVAFEIAPASLLNGLPEEDQIAIQQQAGTPLQINGFDEHGYVELEWWEGENNSRTIWIEPRHLVKVQFTAHSMTVSGTKKSKREKEWRGRVAQAWIKMSQSLRLQAPNENDANFWAAMLMQECVWHRPEEAWILIDAIRQTTDEPKVLEHLAARHLEDLLVKHGDKFIDRFESLAKQDKDFQHMLGWVWLDSVPEEVGELVKVIRILAKRD